MPNTPFTQQRSVQFRGPTTSEDYNQRIEENYNDITLLYNQTNLNQSIAQSEYTRFVKDQFGIERMLEDLESRVASLESDSNQIVFYHDDQIDNVLFSNTEYAIPTINQCQLDTSYGVLTLPLVANSSVSKLSFTDSNNNVTIPATLQTSVVGAGADSGTAIIDTSPPELAIARNVGSIWQRNVIVPAPVYGGAQLTLYIAAPVDLYTTPNSNAIQLNPFPAFSSDITSVAYTTNTNLTLTDSDGYQNFFSYYSGNTSSIGWTPPGTWPGDADLSAGSRVYYFDPQPITGLKIEMNQSNYYFDGSNYIYSYGASLIDLRYQKFLTTGQTIVRMDAPSGGVINNVTDVEPQIYNINQADLDNVFSYQVIYETAYQSGIYTLTPVPNSLRAWIQVTLNQTTGGGTPALSSLSITYS